MVDVLSMVDAGVSLLQTPLLSPSHSSFSNKCRGVIVSGSLCDDREALFQSHEVEDAWLCSPWIFLLNTFFPLHFHFDFVLGPALGEFGVNSPGW